MRDKIYFKDERLIEKTFQLKNYNKWMNNINTQT